MHKEQHEQTKRRFFVKRVLNPTSIRNGWRCCANVNRLFSKNVVDMQSVANSNPDDRLILGMLLGYIIGFISRGL